MSIQTFTDNRGTYAVDWDRVRSIIRSNSHQSAIVNNGQTVSTSQGWFLPDIVSWEVDWRAQARERDQQTESAMQHLLDIASNATYDSFRGYLATRINETRAYRETFRDNMRSASRATSQSVERHVNAYSTGEHVSRWVRDRAVDTLLVGATMMTGGAAAAAAGIGSFAKGAANYQDNQNIGRAMVTTAGSFIITLIPVARGAMASGAGQVASAAVRSTGERVAEAGAVVILEASFAMVDALLDKKALGDTAIRVSAEAGTNQALGAVLDSRNVKRLIDRLPLPAQIAISVGAGLIPGAVGNAVAPSASEQNTAARLPLPDQVLAQPSALDLAVYRIDSQ